MGLVIVKGEGTVLRVMGRPIATNGAFATRFFSNYFEDLFFLFLKLTSRKLQAERKTKQKRRPRRHVTRY